MHSRTQWALEALRYRCNVGRLADVFDHLGRGIVASRARIDAVVRDAEADDGYKDTVAEEERELIDNLTGGALVTCQAAVSGIVAAVQALGVRYEEETREKLPGLITSRTGLLGLSDQLPEGCSKAEAIDALANYYKHHDQWPEELREENEIGVWQWRADTGSERTILQVRKLGLRPHDSRNLRQAGARLGLPSEGDLHILGQIIETWAARVSSHVEERLVAAGVSIYRFRAQPPQSK